MKVLVIGTGGREHAILRSLQTSSSKPKLYVYPGNDGHSDCAEIVQLKNSLNSKPVSDSEKIVQIFSEIIEFCQAEKIDFVFIGPENELVLGLSDRLRSAGIPCVGPSQEAAQLEGSKIFSKNFLNEFRIPTAKHVEISSVEETMSSAQNFKPPYIFKADGLAAGKGVYICKSVSELQQAAVETFQLKKFGSSGNRAILEENLPGFELSVLVLTNGESFSILPMAQDHKRLKDADLGPNTGGMGTIAPMTVDPTLMKKITERIVQPSIAGLEKRKLIYRGILFIGVMVVDNDPYVLEYNVRFGDPETQVVLPLIKNDSVQLFSKLAHGELQPVVVNQKFTACIVNAAAGYPDQVVKGSAIQINENHRKNILFCGVKKNSAGHLETNGGRVLNVVTEADSLHQALHLAYKINSEIKFEGRQFRSDIGKNVLPVPAK